MKTFSLVPDIHLADSLKDFCSSFILNTRDLVITSRHIWDNYLKDLNTGANYADFRKYGRGEPTDKMAEGLYSEIKDLKYERIIAIGGGTILDVAKLFALKNIAPIPDLFEKKLEIIKDKKLVLIPTTCGTGSEVTNISVLEITARNSKMGLAADELYADHVVLVPELLETLPFKYFATSSLDAFIHAAESYLSPKATIFTENFSFKAMELILKGYKEIVLKGQNERVRLTGDFLKASTFAGIAFGNAGCGAVHAMSYPLGANFHIPHGEANYALFTGVFKEYQRKNPGGKIALLNSFIAGILDCKPEDVYNELETIFNKLIQKKYLEEYGMSESQVAEFAASVIKGQGRLLANNYIELSEEDISGIYEKLLRLP